MQLENPFYFNKGLTSKALPRNAKSFPFGSGYFYIPILELVSKFSVSFIRNYVIFDVEIYYYPNRPTMLYGHSLFNILISSINKICYDLT